jgi:hypothetical protein
MTNLGDLEAKQFLYMHLAARGFKIYFISPLGRTQMEYCKFYGAGDKHVPIPTEP